MLEAHDLAARRGTARLFAGLGLRVGAGTALVVTGANGRGKTTLLRMLAGFTLPDAGEIRLDGAAVAPFSPTLRSAVTFAGHALALKDEFTARENLASLVELAGAPATDAELDAALERVALASRRSLPARVLSQGQRRRIGLARLALSRRRVWILDEPVTALDTAGAALLADLVARHLDRGGLAVAATQLTTSGGVMRTRSLSLELAPGSPLCETCHGPLDAVASGPGALVSCATCRTQRTYRLPQASAPVEGMPAVVLADDLCTDGAEARTDVGAGGVVALRCPTCNAALQSTAEQSLVACPFCRTLCRIPSKTLAALHPSAHVRRPFWLLFTGPSRLRRTLVEAARHDAAAREKVAAEQRLAEESRIELEEPPILVDPPEHKLLRSALVLFVLLVVGGVFFAGRIGAILSAAP